MGDVSSQAVLIDRPGEGDFPQELLVMPGKRSQCHFIVIVSQSLWEMCPAMMWKQGMAIALLFPVDVVNNVTVKEKSKPLTSELAPTSFNFGDSPVPPEWKQTKDQKIMEMKDIFSPRVWHCCARSTEHTIRVTDDRPFRESSRYLPDLRKHLNDRRGRDHYRVPKPLCIPNSCGVKDGNGTICMWVNTEQENKLLINTLSLA